MDFRSSMDLLWFFIVVHTSAHWSRTASRTRLWLWIYLHPLRWKSVLWQGLSPTSKLLISQCLLSICLKTCLKTRQTQNSLPSASADLPLRGEAWRCFLVPNWRFWRRFTSRSIARPIHTARDRLFCIFLERYQQALHVCCRIAASFKKCSCLEGKVQTARHMHPERGRKCEL